MSHDLYSVNCRLTGGGVTHHISYKGITVRIKKLTVSMISPVINNTAQTGETYLISHGDQINKNIPANDRSQMACLKRSVHPVN